jgi:hypothetical protein
MTDQIIVNEIRSDIIEVCSSGNVILLTEDSSTTLAVSPRSADQIIVNEIKSNIIEASSSGDIVLLTEDNSTTILASNSTQAEKSFESVVSNLKSLNVIDTTFSSSVITKTFDSGSGKTIVVTINLVNGLNGLCSKRTKNPFFFNTL